MDNYLHTALCVRGNRVMFRRKKKQEQTFAQQAARFVLTKTTRKLTKKDLEVEIEGQKFYFIDMPLVKKKKG